MKSVFLQPTVIIASLFILVLIGGGSYAAIKIYSNEQNKDATVRRAQQLATGHASAEQIAAELANARVIAQKESDRLNLFMNYPTSGEALAAVRQEVYENILNDFDKKIETITKTTAESDLNDSNKKIQDEIAEEKAHIQEILKQWQELVNNPALNSSPAAAAQTLQYANQIQTDINDIKKIVDGLTPENSGLNASEIIAINSDVTGLIGDISQAVSDLGQTTVPPTIITGQQQDVTNANNNVTDLQQDLIDANNANNSNNSNGDSVNNSGTNQNGDQGQTTGSTGDNNTSGSDSTSGLPPGLPSDSTSGSNSSTGDYSNPNYPGTRYVPPPPATDPSKPKLIEGANIVQ